LTDALAFSRPVRVDALPKDGLQQVIEANPAERAALAKLNDLPSIARLTADLRLTRAGRGAVRVRGEVYAEVTQTCVVTLEPIEAIVKETVDVRFAEPAQEHKRGNLDAPGVAELVDLDSEDPPDAIENGRIDLGALAAEFLALGLDPYPRKPGAALETG
jgi:hypothetical protein